jgi:hypothetical protein
VLRLEWLLGEEMMLERRPLLGTGGSLPPSTDDIMINLRVGRVDR